MINFIKYRYLLDGCNKRTIMKKAYLVLENKSEDYHGTYTTPIKIFGTLKKAQKYVKSLEETNLDYDTHYTIETFNIE